MFDVFRARNPEIALFATHPTSWQFSFPRCVTLQKQAQEPRGNPECGLLQFGQDRREIDHAFFGGGVQDLKGANDGQIATLRETPAVSFIDQYRIRAKFLG